MLELSLACQQAEGMVLQGALGRERDGNWNVLIREMLRITCSFAGPKQAKLEKPEPRTFKVRAHLASFQDMVSLARWKLPKLRSTPVIRGTLELCIRPKETALSRADTVKVPALNPPLD